MAEKKTAEPKETKKLYRLPQQGKIAGVCAGLADYLDIDVSLLRVIFVVLAFASGGFWVLVYFLMAVVMPVKRGSRAESTSDIGDNFKELASDIENNGGVGRIRFYVGLALVVFGFWLLLDRLFPELFSFNWNIVWPGLLVIFGVLLLLKGRN